MAEHDERNFEHSIEEKLRRLDGNIKIPEIPDAQSIFEKAEQSTKVVPFAKYTRYIATAAAVVLICVSIPVLTGAFSVKIAEPESADMAEEAVMESYLFDDASYSDEESAEKSLSIDETDGFAEPGYTEPEEDKKANDINGSVAETGKVAKALERFFAMNSVESSSSSAETDAFTGGSGGVDITYPAVDSFTEEINSKRSIDISIEEDSVSVILNDNSAGEIITAFWAEGKYESSGIEGENYVIRLANPISLGDFNEGYYLPMIGDMLSGTYTIPEEDVSVAENVTKGMIMLIIEVNIGSGEYIIKASLV